MRVCPSASRHLPRRGYRAKVRTTIVAYVPVKVAGLGLCFAVPRLQSSNDESRQRAAPTGRTIMLTRRKFIGTTLVTGAALTASMQQARLQPTSKRTIVDAQVH